ncbi:MAG: G5 domain-containing protein [Armatimonadota bacterium]|nr:G5 domain-containing protein [Armatimonadota bacterium]
METSPVTPDWEKVAASLRRQLLIERLLILLILLFVLGKWGYTYLSSSSCVVLANGAPIVTVENRGVANELLDEVLNSAAGDNAEDAEFAQTIELRRKPSASPLDRESALAILKMKLIVWADKWAVLIDGKPHAALDTKEQAGETLELARQRYGKLAPNLLDEPSFKQNVTVQLQKVDMRKWRKTPIEAAELLFSSDGKPAIHVVKKGEVASVIAERYDMPLAEMRKLNPGRSLDRLQIGDKLKVGRGNTPLTVVVHDLITRTESIPPPVQSVTSVQMFAGKTTVLTPGRSGKRIAKFQVNYENGVQTGRELLEETIIRQPSPRRIAVGVKPRR